MANIGEQLLQPEAGWQRIDDTHPYILYSSNWKETSLSGFYNGKTHYLESLSTDVIKNEFIRIKFFGTKILLPMQTYIDYSSSVEIDLDGEKQVINLNDATNPRTMVLSYRKDNLENKEHAICIKSLDGLRFGFDCVDIDSNGYLLPQAGCSLVEPEKGWIRINDDVVFPSEVHNTLQGAWKNTICTIRKDVTFYVYTDKLRVISQHWNDEYRVDDLKIYIDDVLSSNPINTKDVLNGNLMILDYEKIFNKYSPHKITFSASWDASSVYVFDALDMGENAKILSEEEYKQLLNKHLVKSNDKYYTIEDNTLVEITEEITHQLIKTKGISVSTLTANQSLLPDKFKLISHTDNIFNINAIKSKKELIVASDSFNTTVQSNIDFFDVVGIVDTGTSIKVVFSIDNGITWKSYDTEFKDLSITIPLKPYEELTSEELVQWDTARDVISEQGIDIANLSKIDFNTLNMEKIRFAYVLSINSKNDKCCTSQLKWQFDSKGTMKSMTSDELEIELLQDSIKVTPKVSSDMIKINFSNGSSSNINIDNLSDEDIQKLKTRLGLS